jgi:DNA polymerase-3 subunit epsilon
MFRRWWPWRTRDDSEIERRAREHCRHSETPDDRGDLTATRFSVVDTETTSIDPRSADVLSIGTCRVEGGAISLTETYEIAVRPSALSDHENVLIHGIGHARQAEGGSRGEALAAWIVSATPAVLVGYHALFDASVIARAARDSLGIRLSFEWLDIALLMPALFDDSRSLPQVQPLDHWLHRFAITNSGRHGAAADAYVTAQLLLMVLHRASTQGIRDVRGLRRLQHDLLKRLTAATASGTGA